MDKMTNTSGVSLGGLREAPGSWLIEQQSKLEELRRAIRLVRQSPLTIAGFSIVAILVLVAIFAPEIAPYNPIKVRLRDALLPPSRVHLFGTDGLGRDVFSRFVHGARVSLRVGLLSVLVISGIGVPLGALAGYMGGKADTLIMRVGDMFLAFPNLVLALAIAAALGGGIETVIIAIAAPAWPWYARLVRGLTLSAREEQYVEAAEAIGCGRLRVLFKHILPNTIGPVIVQVSMSMGYAILTAAALGFIGIGAQPPTPEWGLMVSVGRIHFMDQPWVSTFPGLAIMITVLGYQLMGDGLRDILDPQTRRG